MGNCKSTTIRQVDNDMGSSFSTPVCDIKIEDHVAYYGAAKLGRPLVYGHRGGSKKYPENTIQAFRDARKNGADGVELDVFLTTDNQVICFHDETTARLVDGADTTIIKAKWEGDLETRKHKRKPTHSKKKRYPISLLKNVFKEFKDVNSNAGLPFVLNVELKPVSPSLLHQSKVGKYVANLVRKYKMEAQVTIVGFDPFKLRDVENTYKGLHTGWQYDDDMLGPLGEAIGKANVWYKEETDANRAEMTKDKSSISRFLMEKAIGDRLIGATIVDLEHTVCDNDTIQKFHDKKFAVGCFTFFPTDLSTVHALPGANEDPYTHSKNILRQVMKRKVNWIETDSLAFSFQAIREIRVENAKLAASASA